MCGTLCAQRSPFNGLEVLPADSAGHYRILIGGHFHGESTNRSGYPAATLLANLDTINDLGANLFLSTGDLFMDPVNDMPRYQRALFGKLKMPLFNAPGNHDVDRHDRRTFHVQAINLQRCSGSGNDRIEVGNQNEGTYDPHMSACVLLNTERDDGLIADDQFDVFERALRVVRDTSNCRLRRLFIISHRPIWSEDDPQYSDLFQGNTRSVLGTNFQKDVYPLLEKIAEHAHVYWISGSLGGGTASSIFFQEHAPNITYIQCAIRDEPRDALLIADVYPDTVKWSALSLTGQQLLAPEEYDAAWWREHIGKKEPFNWRLVPMYVKNTVLRKEFWFGVLGGMLVVMLIRRLYRR